MRLLEGALLRAGKATPLDELLRVGGWWELCDEGSGSCLVVVCHAAV